MRSKRQKIAAVFCAVITVFGIGESATVKSVAYTAKNSESRIIIIDPGHGGFDSGAVAADGTYEKDINLALSLKLFDFFCELGFTPVLTRTTDTALADALNTKTTKRIDLSKRLEYMRKYPQAIFLSIHQNKFSDENVHGLQTFYKENSENGKLLAECIQAFVTANIQKDNTRAAKTDTRKIYLIENSTVPTVFVECGFLSNGSDLKNLKNENYTSALAYCIVAGTLEYYNSFA